MVLEQELDMVLEQELDMVLEQELDLFLLLCNKFYISLSPFSKVTVNVSDLVRMNAKTDMKILLCSTGPGAGARYGPGAEAGYGSGERTGYGP